MDNCIFPEVRAVRPNSLRQRILQLAHEGHCGIVKMKHRCRETVWWPRIDHDIEDFCAKCTACIISDKGHKGLACPTLKPIEYPSKPWSKISMDIVGELHGVPPFAKFLLVAIDLHSKWP